MGPTQQELRAAELDLSSFYTMKPDDSTSFPSLFYDEPFPSTAMSSVDSSTGDTPDSGSLSPSSSASINLISDTSAAAAYQESNNDTSINAEKRKATPSVDEKATKAPKTLPAKKAGRKPNVTERASKRKEQNRAAQRAFRERKEKHLQDLEDRIAELENETTTATSENDFLKDQVRKLQDELKRYQASRSSSSTVLQTPYSNFTFEFPFYKDPKSETTMSSDRSSSTNSMQSTPESSEPTSLSHLGSVSSVSSSPEQNLSSGKTGVDKFCDELNLACGTRENPIPRNAGVKPPYISSLSVLPSTEEPVKLGDKPTFVSPPAFEMDFLSDYRDPIFDEEGFNLPELTTEISAFDPLEPFLQGTDPGALYPSSLAAPATKPAGAVSVGSTHKEEEETVPARSETFLPCHAVWDKISAHPKFGEIDINGLCAELRTKARCSTTGAVMSEQDVKQVLSLIGV